MPFLSVSAISNLEKLRQGYTSLFSARQQLRTRWELIDKYIAREMDTTVDGKKGQLVNRNGDRTKIANQEIPVCFAQADTAHAFLVGVFLIGNPVFSVIAPRKYEDAMTMMQALCARDQAMFGWVGNLSGCMLDAIKYNFCAAEVVWKTKKVSSIVTDRSPQGKKTAIVESKEYEGNQIKTLDMYNVIFDQSVPPHQVHELGSYAGYFEPLNYIRAKTHLQELDPDYAIYRNVGDALSGARGCSNETYVPSIRRDGQTYDTDDWSSYWGNSAKNAEGNYKGRYELLTVYCRIIPQEYGVSNIQNSGTPAIWKLEWLNGALIYAEPLTNVHSFLPIVIGMAMQDKLGMQTKSFAENVMDLQDGTTSLINGTLASLRRAVADRALYDPTRVSPQDVNAPIPEAKIPVKMSMHQKTLEEAYKQIPFNDSATPYFLQNFQVLNGLIEVTTGMNRASQGNFQKGNKTMTEFETVMNKSDARSQKMAINLETNFYAPIKHMVKCNYIQYAVREELQSPDKDSQDTVQVDPQTLRDAILAFEVSDGTMPNDKLANNDVLVAAINTIAQQPDLSLEYDVGGIIVHLLKTKGTDLSQFKRTPDQQAQYAQLQQARAAQLPGQPAGQNPARGQQPTQTQ